MIPRRFLVLLAVPAIAFALVAASTALAGPTPEAAVAELNTWRAELGESTLSPTTVAAWNSGCNHHDIYEHLNGNALTHVESSGNPGYTSDGKEAGEDSVLAAAISAPGPTPEASLLPGPTWDAAVFHRAALLQPRLAQTGFDSTTFLEGGVYRTFGCMRILGGASEESRKTPGLILYPSPGNGAYDVPTTFPAGSEAPDPAAETGVPAGATLGWLLNVEINGPWAIAGGGFDVDAHGVTATLAPDGTSSYVPLVVSQCGPSGCGGAGGTAEGSYFDGGFGIFPTQPLAADTTYRAVLTGGTVTDQLDHVDYPIPAGYSWCFSTGPVYTVSADCAPPTTAAEEPANANAGTALSFTTASSTAAVGGGSQSAPAPAVLPPPVHHCRVPKLVGKNLKALKKKLKAADCKLGRVVRKAGATAKTGKVSHQSAEPGATLAAGAKVDVTLKG